MLATPVSIGNKESDKNKKYKKQYLILQIAWPTTKIIFIFLDSDP